MKKILASVLLIFGLCWDSQSSTLDLPECQMSRTLETPITFFISDSVQKDYESFVIEDHIQRWITFSNSALKNSCIPIKRTLDKIIYAPKILGEEAEEFSVVHDFLAYYYSKEVERVNGSKTGFYGLVFKKNISQFTTDWCGETRPSVYPQFFTIGLTCKDHVLEHELGHLAWASHDMETLSNQTGGMPFDLSKRLPLSLVSKITKYSYGYICGGKGTIMAYADETHPFYSSPEISYENIVCGNAAYADNARVLREYAIGLMGE
ncbi:hypothetical protein [Vibrio natriegens]|uniref:hypothetical protein n=1 Tax=Vibrio natriegens TaxID=691 RepID=UPI001FBB6036|nr:hypothetical protein [Vibrio natriegens]